MLTRSASSTIQRLAACLLRQRQFSIAEISAATGLQSKVVRGLVHDAADLEVTTLQEAGASDDKRLCRLLFLAAHDFAYRYIIDHELAVLKGNSPTDTIAELQIEIALLAARLVALEHERQRDAHQDVRRLA